MIDGEVGSVAEDTSTIETEEVDNDQPEDEIEVSGEYDEDADDDESSDSDQSDEDDEDSEEVAEADFVEVEYDGKVHKVPSELKDALMLTKDYTHKTQALAETRKAFEAEQQDFRQYVEASTANSERMAELKSIDSQLTQLQQYDWNAAYDADLTGATKLRHQMEQLGQQRNALVQDIQQSEGERQRLYQDNLMKKAQRTDAQLKTEIPNWGDELKAELGQFAVETMGFSPQAVSQAVTPEQIKALYYANVGYKALNKAKQTTAAAKKPKEVQKPPKKVSPNRQKAPSDLSKISDPAAYREAYMARRRKQG
jgi:hypothetical protein